MKKTSTFQNSLIWFGAGVSLAEILTGTSFAPLDTVPIRPRQQRGPLTAQ